MKLKNIIFEFYILIKTSKICILKRQIKVKFFKNNVKFYEKNLILFSKISSHLWF